MSKTMSDKTRENVGLPPNDDSLSSALGVSRVTTVESSVYDDNKILKAERELLRSQALEIEDDPFVQLNIATLGEKNQILEPTYNPISLMTLTHQNNTLLQAISAMEINVDGTGYEIERRDGEEMSEEDEKKAEKISEFFDEPYPGESFLTIRRKLRRDIESTGNGYLEVIRNVKGDVVFIRHIEAKMMRLLRLDDATMMKKTIMRGGKEITVNVYDRRRRFVQVVGRNKVKYFKEYGEPAVLDALDGRWEGAPEAGSQGTITGEPNDPVDVRRDAYKGEKVKAGNRATEILHFTALPDVLTPYGVPRWINNLPSVLGSRKAEEFNLEFFDHGGLPPAMILIQGGQLSKDARDELSKYLAGKASMKQRGVIAEIFAASGDLGSAGSVKVSVERFGDERQKDSMFMQYDGSCAEHVRISFRLPPMFLGLSEAYNFATAYTAYMIAEAQVFSPEREEFDEIINLTFMREMHPEYIYRSVGLNVVDVEQKLKGLEMSKDYMNPTSFIHSMNETLRTDFVPKEDIDEEVDKQRIQEEVNQITSLGERREAARQDLDENGNPVVNNKGDGQGRVLKDDFPFDVLKFEDDILKELADDWTKHLEGSKDFDDEQVETMSKLIRGLNPQLRKMFNGYVGLRMVNSGYDEAGIAELLGCVGHRHDDSEAEA